MCYHNVDFTIIAISYFILRQTSDTILIYSQQLRKVLHFAKRKKNVKLPDGVNSLNTNCGTLNIHVTRVCLSCAMQCVWHVRYEYDYPSDFLIPLQADIIITFQEVSRCFQISSSAYFSFLLFNFCPHTHTHNGNGDTTFYLPSGIWTSNLLWYKTEENMTMIIS